MLTKPIDEFIKQYFARHGCREEIHGLALGLLQAFSELVLYLKLWQDGGFLSEDVKPELIDKMTNDKMIEFRWWQYQAKIDETNVFGKLWYKLIRKLGL